MKGNAGVFLFPIFFLNSLIFRLITVNITVVPTNFAKKMWVAIFIIIIISSTVRPTTTTAAAISSTNWLQFIVGATAGFLFSVFFNCFII